MRARVGVRVTATVGQEIMMLMLRERVRDRLRLSVRVRLSISMIRMNRVSVGQGFVTLVSLSLPSFIFYLLCSGTVQ